DENGSAPWRVASAPASEPSSPQSESAWDRFTASVARTFNPQSAPQPTQSETKAAAIPAPKSKPKPTTAVAQTAKPAAKPQQVASESKPRLIAEAPPAQPESGNASSTTAQAPSASGSFESRWSGR